jgi:hypothetical protein
MYKLLCLLALIFQLATALGALFVYSRSSIPLLSVVFALCRLSVNYRIASIRAHFFSHMHALKTINAFNSLVALLSWSSFVSSSIIARRDFS